MEVFCAVQLGSFVASGTLLPTIRHLFSDCLLDGQNPLPDFSGLALGFQL